MNSAIRLRVGAFALAAFALAAAPAQAADDAPRFAWGKAGVSYDAWRAEAYECALDGLSIDVANTEPVERLRRASRQMEALDSRQSGATAADPVAAGVRYAQDVDAVRNSARAEQQVEEVKRIMFSAMQRCMVGRGYTRFALTEAQRAELARFEDGTQERRAALHRLASEAAVLETQKQPLPEG
jgi:hypothetical protein